MKELRKKIAAAAKHSHKLFISTDDKEYHGQFLALEAVLAALNSGGYSRLNHLSTFVKKEHRP